MYRFLWFQSGKQKFLLDHALESNYVFLKRYSPPTELQGQAGNGTMNMRRCYGHIGISSFRKFSHHCASECFIYLWMQQCHNASYEIHRTGSPCSTSCVGWHPTTWVTSSWLSVYIHETTYFNLNGELIIVTTSCFETSGYVVVIVSKKKEAHVERWIAVSHGQKCETVTLLFIYFKGLFE